ncbi:uncharacterized protein LOC116613006 [Nematostella vectensis]|uniref:uncharacterized protein LOC116613006 n=1 Tax=Nematostella vectensis TaxID=45351 RepID=UPI001390099A|nr:uncharacterized protein LOC116613006 [Nematostella vectensis]
MATANAEAKHFEILKGLCRVCGKRLKKAKSLYAQSFACGSFKTLLEVKFGINVEKDDPYIHPMRFCKLCRLATTDKAPIIWEIHREEDCPTCALEEQIQKGGRPKKAKRGGARGQAKNSAWEETTNAGLKAQLIARVTELSASMNTLRDHRFTERFDFFETKKEEFHCAICLDVLEKPLSSKCQHSCCSDCWKSAFELGEKHPACPICQETLADPNDLQRAPLVLIQLLEGYLVKCRACGTRLPYHLCNSHPCPPRKRQRANSPVPAAAVVLDPQTRTLEQMLNEVRTGLVSPDVARLGNLIVNTICKNSEDGITARLPGSGKPTVVMKIPQAQASSSVVSVRQKQRRTKALIQVGEVVSKGEMDLHTVEVLKRKNAEERKQLLKDVLGKELVLEIPKGDSLAMKADLGVTWYKLNKLRGWFSNWGIQMESEKKQRAQKKEQVGDNLADEDFPMEHSRREGRKYITVIKQTPCAYVDDLKGHIIKYIDDNNSAGLLTWHGGNIPENSVFLKLGGDHGQGNMKFAFQLANVDKPNSSKKTVVFCVFEAKDTRNNLRAATQRYKEQLGDLESLQWRDKKIKLFLFGDFEFLCKFLGISGASDRKYRKDL